MISNKNFLVNNTVGLFVSDEAFLNELNNALVKQQINVVMAAKVDRALLSFFPQGQDALSFGAVIVDLSLEQDFVNVCQELVKRLSANTKIIVLGRDDSVKTLHALQNLGIYDYWSFPISIPDLTKRVKQLVTPASNKKNGKKIVVIGCGAGIGSGICASMLASNFALGQKTVLVDARVDDPSCGSVLGVDTPGSLNVLIEGQDRIDNVLLNQALIKVTDNLSFTDDFVFAKGNSKFAKNNDVSRLMEALAADFSVQVWRIPASSSLLSSALINCDAIVPIVGGSFASLRIAEALSQSLKPFAHDKEILWVFNKRDALVTINAQEASKHLGVNFAQTLPYIKKLNQDLLESKQLTAKGYPLMKACAVIASELAEDALSNTAVKKSFLASLLR